MSTLSPRPLHPTFLPSLNALLAALSLPFSLDHPADLTPSLLLAIFESIISARLPIPLSVRQSRTQDAKSRAMLVLLGVLECDVLRGGTAAADADGDLSIAASNLDDSALGAAGGVSVDGWVDEIGLGQVDPERLADGGWEETIFVGELLCWLARRRGILPRIRSSRLSSRPRSLYSNHHSYGTEEGEGEGDTVDLSTSLLLQPSSAQKSRSPRAPSPSRSIGEASVDPNFSTFSHISDVPRHPLVHSPEPSLSASATTHTDLSIRARSISSRTSISNTHDDLDHFEGASQDTLQMYNLVRMMQDAVEDDDQPPSFRPQCIHELEDPSYIRALAGPSSSFGHSVSHEQVDSSRDEDDDADEQDNDDLYAPPTPTPRRVRLNGWIDPVDAATELSSFVASRTRSRAFPTSAGSGSGPPFQSNSFKHVQTGETSKSVTSRLGANVSPPSRLERLGKFYAPHNASPLPSRSSSPSPPLLISSPNHLARRLPPSPPLSPSSPPTHADQSFDISFSKPDNTSTPAKPRPPRRLQFQTVTHQEFKSKPHVGVDVGRSGGSSGKAAARSPSPSCTPSPSSFTTPGSLRSGGASGMSGGSRTSSTASSGTRTRVSGIPVSSAQSSAMAAGAVASDKKWSGSPAPTTMLPLSSTKGKSPPPVPLSGSTTMTNTLLTERARLLTELAALKRVRAAAASGAGVTRTSSGAGVGNVGHRVGVGV